MLRLEFAGESLHLTIGDPSPLERGHIIFYCDHLSMTLVEGGFLTNLTDAKQINTAVYRGRLAQAIANGVVLYQKSVNRAVNEF